MAFGNLPLSVAILDENLKGESATFDWKAMHTLRCAWMDVKDAIAKADLILSRRSLLPCGGDLENERAPASPSAGPYADGWRLVPDLPTDDMMMAARGLLMAMSFNAPDASCTLGSLSERGFYGEHWAHILSDDERAMTGPLTKAHRAQLIYRAMIAAAPSPPALDASGAGE